MILLWKEVRKLIILTICPKLEEIGFINPGKTMWRYRTELVDVVNFYYVRRFTGFAIELGCNPRKLHEDKPMPEESIFRTRYFAKDKRLTIGGIIPIKNTAEEQSKMLIAYSQEIQEYITNWFSLFGSLQEASKRLNNCTDEELLQIISAGKGSTVYNKSVQVIESILK